MASEYHQLQKTLEQKQQEIQSLHEDIERINYRNS